VLARRPCAPIAAVALALAALLSAVPVMAFGGGTPGLPDAALKAAFLYNFAKFTDWPALADAVPIIVCVVGDDDIAAAFVGTVRGQLVSGHKLELSRPPGIAEWHACQVLFIGDAELRRSGAGLDGIKALPVLTISDVKGFAQSAGIIELYPEGGKMRFAINIDAAERAGVHLSSRLLGLARIVRSDHVQ
jgi:hypothetical protein